MRVNHVDTKCNMQKKRQRYLKIEKGEKGEEREREREREIKR